MKRRITLLVDVDKLITYLHDCGGGEDIFLIGATLLGDEEIEDEAADRERSGIVVEKVEVLS